MKILKGLLVVAFFIWIVWYAPIYLVYADLPDKSDVIILFFGLDFNARIKEALTLIDEGYAQQLFIHSYSMVFDAP